jgi:hypothetical protein
MKSVQSLTFCLLCIVTPALFSQTGLGNTMLIPGATAFVAPSYAATTCICRRQYCNFEYTRLKSQQQPGHYICRPNLPQGPISFELGFGENGNVRVELSSPDDIQVTAQLLSHQFGGQYNVRDIERVLQQSWDSATSLSPIDSSAMRAAPPVYNGPKPPSGSSWNAECTIELASGLILELGPSTIGEDAGLGLFVRQSPTAEPILQTQGSAFCGYGPCLKVTDTLEGLSEYQRQRTFEFVLPDSLGSYVWFNGELQTIWDAMQQSQATGIRSHVLDHHENGELYLIPNTVSPCYMIPPEERLDPKTQISIQTIGHMCNDLAGGIQTTKDEYDAKSSEANLLVLVPRVEMKENGMIEPSGMPILTLAKTIFVANTDSPMEVGLRYGAGYWNSNS